MITINFTYFALITLALCLSLLINGLFIFKELDRRHPNWFYEDGE